MIRVAGLAVLLLITVALSGCTGDPGGVTVLKVLPAGSLLIPFEEAEAEFEALHPGVDVQLEGHGSIQVIRQVTDLHRAADVVAVADESLIPDMMYRRMEGSEENYTDWYIPFATNEMVIAYTPASRYAAEITSENWYEILDRPGVRTGFSNPMLDAAGYRTLMVVQLAESEYGNETLFASLIGNHFDPPLEVTTDAGVTTIHLPQIMKPSDQDLVIRDGSIYLISLLQAGGIDYAFEYRSVADAVGLEWISLPESINLGSSDLEQEYSKVKVELGFQRFSSIGKERTGRHIVYAITIPANAPNPALAEEFMDYVLAQAEKGRPGWPPPLGKGS
ncbi:MAG TPA: tungstate ABC transporter substrate-binding protein WtpA [Methanoregulaceae archaeon]|nr:tungstate ABC transporter substrate-binding protein WtpA [Methanoregulaceae archaeon]